MKSVFIWILLGAPPLFIPQADSDWPSTWPSLMREFLNIRGCLTHILALNQPSCSHLYHQGPAAVIYSREKWRIRKEHVACLYGELQAGTAQSLRDGPPCNLNPPPVWLQQYLNIKMMPFWWFYVKVYPVPCPPGMLLLQPTFPWMGTTPGDVEIDSEQSGTKN